MSESKPIRNDLGYKSVGLTKDDRMVLEERQGIAASRRQLCRRLSPSRRIWRLTIRDISRDSCAIEIPWRNIVSPLKMIDIQLHRLPNSNPFLIPFHGVDTPSLGVEVGTIRCTAPFSDATSSITADGAITVKIPLTNYSIYIVSLKRKHPTTTVPVKLSLGVRVQPGPVCQVTWLCSLS